MANSPLILPPGSSEKPIANKSKLQAVASNGATPESTTGTYGTAPDLAEQMNDEEKRKYVKGYIP